MRVRVKGFEGELVSIEGIFNNFNEVLYYKVVVLDEDNEEIIFNKVDENDIEIIEEFSYETSEGIGKLAKMKDTRNIEPLIEQMCNIMFQISKDDREFCTDNFKIIKNDKCITITNYGKGE